MNDLKARLEALERKWREISSRPNRPTGFLLCADDLAAALLVGEEPQRHHDVPTEGDLPTDHPNRCKRHDRLVWVDLFNEDGSHRPMWRCHKRAGHDGPCSSHNDCGVIALDGVTVCGLPPSHSGPHAYQTNVAVGEEPKKKKIRTISDLIDCGYPETTEVILVLHDYCTPCQCTCHNTEFGITIEEARALNYLIQLHHGLMKESEYYVHLLRLINGLGQFVDKHDESRTNTPIKND